MAALTSTQVALEGGAGNLSGDEFWLEKKGVYMRRLVLNLTGQGTAANNLGAAALGFNKVYMCSDVYDAVNGKVLPASVDPANNWIVIGGGAANILQDITTATAYIEVVGT